MVAREWKEFILPADRHAPLGTSAWKHVHSDETEHDTEFTPPKGMWGGLFGTIPAGGKIECLDCGKVVEGV